MKEILTNIRKELEKNIDKKTLATGQHFFKEKIKQYGVRIPTVHSISKVYYKLIEFEPKAEIFDVCGHLWKSGYLEESFIACDMSYYLRKKYEPEDFKVFENWINKYVNNWASCDSLCNHTIGEFIEMYPEYLQKLKDLARSENRWMRRASAVSLIVPAKKGKFLNDIFEIADILLLDKDDLVQKGYGWMLKAASKAHQQKVFDYVFKNKDVMPRTALRYAIEKMPDNLKNIAMKR
jgi:3-methyladenine DNA glycosylase AlkD